MNDDRLSSQHFVIRWPLLRTTVKLCSEAISDENVSLEIQPDLRKALRVKLQKCILLWESMDRRSLIGGNRWAFDRLGNVLRAVAQRMVKSTSRKCEDIQFIRLNLLEAVELALRIEIDNEAPKPVAALSADASSISAIERRETLAQLGREVFFLPVYEIRINNHILWELQGGRSMTDSVKGLIDLLEIYRKNAYDFARLIAKDPKDVTSRRKLEDEQRLIGSVKRKLAEIGNALYDDPIDSMDLDDLTSKRAFEQIGTRLEVPVIGDLKQERRGLKEPHSSDDQAHNRMVNNVVDLGTTLTSMSERLKEYSFVLHNPNLIVEANSSLHGLILHRLGEVLGEIESLREVSKLSVSAEVLAMLSRIESELRSAIRVAQRLPRNVDVRAAILQNIMTCLKLIDSLLRSRDI